MVTFNEITEIKNQFVDEVKEMKNQIVDEVVDNINPTIAASCGCCNDITKSQYGESIQYLVKKTM